MELNDPKLNILLACLEDVVGSLEEYSVNHRDFCLEEIIKIKGISESIKDQRWKLGVATK